MAVLTRSGFFPQEMLDLPGAKAIEAYAQSDWYYFLSGFMSGTSYVLSGFEITDFSSIFSKNGVTIEQSDVVLFHSQAQTQANGFYVSAGTEADAALTLSANQTNYIEADLTNVTGSNDSKSFWNPNGASGAGEAFSADTDTAVYLQLSISSTVSGFTANRIPLYKIITDSNGYATSVTDCRNLFFRLGTGGTSPNPANTFSWPALPDSSHERVENLDGGGNPTSTSSTVIPYQGADKNIKTWKQWMDAIMSIILEFKGTSFWYSTIIGSLTSAWASILEDRSAYIRSTDTVSWSGTQLTFSSDIILELVNTVSGTKTTHAIAHSASPVSIATGQIAYVAINRESSETGLALTVTSSAMPAQDSTHRDYFVLFEAVTDTAGMSHAANTVNLYCPATKQIILAGQTVHLGASPGLIAASTLDAESSSSGQIIQSNGDGTASWVANPNIDSSSQVGNLALAASVATNALTIALKTKAGVDPSNTSPVYIGFRNSTATTGAYNQRTAQAATSLTIPSGTTIGTQNTVATYLYVYALDNAGTIELAVSLSKFDEGSLQTTTAISGGTSATTLYSTTARVNVPIRLIGRINITETTAGTWASGATEVSILPFAARKQPTITRYTSGSGTYLPPPGVKYLKVTAVGGGGGGAASGTGTTAAGNGGATTFSGGSTSISAGGGGAGGTGAVGNGGSGGAATLSGGLNVETIAGSVGGYAPINGVLASASGAPGGKSFFGGEGAAGPGGNAGASAYANSGSGGGGAGGNGTYAAGGGGGAGGLVITIITSLASSYSYSIGTAGTNGSGGTGGYPGGSGGTGVLIIEEYYEQY